jgi:phage-related baseplate assembly protein
MIDLELVPFPGIVEILDFEVIRDAMLTDLQSRDPAFSAILPSDPAYKVIEVAAYREMLIRQRVNDAAQGVMLAFATGSDLDQIGANFEVERLEVTPADPEAIPPVEAVMESDEDFRTRIQMAFEGITVAGSEGAYIFHSLSADGEVKDVGISSPLPGEVLVSVLSRTGDGTADSALIATVNAALNAKEVRPLTDNVTVQSATILSYSITASIKVYEGPDAQLILDTAMENAKALVEEQHKVGHDIIRSAIFAALHVPGVHSVELTSPVADIVCTTTQAAYCDPENNITLTISGVAE